MVFPELVAFECDVLTDDPSAVADPEGRLSGAGIRRRAVARGRRRA